MSSCPAPEMLSQLAYDSSSGLRFAALEAHVQTCVNCQEVLERLAVDASVCEQRGPGRLAEPENPPAIPGFVIERELGRGGMGVVYQAWQPQLARRVAIKVVSASVGIEAEDRRRWLREARAIGRVRHPNVVQIHHAGEQDGCLYLVLDLIVGGSLAERVTGPLPARIAVEVMAAVARAVEQIHVAGMLHLDIKPSNILLDGPPGGSWDQVTPMLADFGIARAGDDPAATATGPIGVGGTPSFMAPEQIAGDRSAMGPRSDVFSLGATLYSLLTGRPPFQAPSVIETLDLVRTREPAPPRTLVPGVPRDLETIALACLRKDPRRRYASAGALADDLQRWLDGFPIQARPVSKLERASRWCQRRPAIASLLAALALTVAFSLVGLITLWRHSEAERGRAENALAHAIESDKATSDTVRDLVRLLATTVETPQMLSSERFEKTSLAVRDLTAKLRRRPVFATSNLVAICELERQLAVDFWRRGNHAESRALLMDSVDLLEARRKSSGAADDDVDKAYARALMELGQVARNQRRFDEALVWFQRAEEALERVVLDSQHLGVIDAIDGSRRAIAAMFGRSGREEQRRRILESHIRMLERLSQNAGADPAIGLLATLVRLDLAADENAIERFRSAIERFPDKRLLPETFKTQVGAWIASDVNQDLSGPSPISGRMGRLDPDAHAALVIGAIESKCKALGVGPSVFPAAAFHVCAIAASRCAAHRNSDRLNEARRTALELSAFAKSLVRSDPHEATFHLILSIAFSQESKNAWRVPDYTAIEDALRKALGAAHTALRLDPRNAVARLDVAVLQEKLIGLPVGRKKHEERLLVREAEETAARRGDLSE
jgi:eukaryotic-like serine/threonine-protein kinase